MRLPLWCICVVILSTLAGCDDLPVGHVLEIHCVDDVGLNNDKLCLKADRPGAELDIRVNETTQKVLIVVVKNDGNWIVKSAILDHCSVVDERNWECNEKKGQAPFMVDAYGMFDGRYYHSLTGGGGVDFFTSSISGLTFLELYFGLIDMPTALTKTGYSAQALQTFGKG